MRRWSLVVPTCLIAACGPAAPGGGHDASSDTAEVIVDASLLPADPCGGQTAACPTAPASFARGDGLRALDRCAFPLTDKATWNDRAALIDALPAAVPRVTLAGILSDLNRTAVPKTSGEVPGTAPGITRAFAWQSGDESVTYWIPQGITGSFDGHADGVVAGKKIVMVSWYYEMANDTGSTTDKGVRIAIVDATSQSTPTYRFALLVAPVSRGGRTDFDPVRVHAGGLAWFGDLLYVPVTGSGFRVFDLTRILRIDGTEDRLGYNTGTGLYDAHGYKYVIPQVGEIIDAGTCNPVFSYVSVDRASTPPSLVSGEYIAGEILGRIYRWPLDPVTGHLQLTDANRVVADAAYFPGESNVQGTLSRGATFWMSSSAPAGSGGALYRAKVDTPSTTLGWIDSPEDLAYDPQLDAVWSLSEGLDARYVIAVSRSAIE